MAASRHMTTTTILVPTFNEEKALPATIAALQKLDPQPDEIVIVDGGSSDRTVALAEAAGLRTLRSPRKGRGAQINFGVSAAAGELVCVLHADSVLPVDAVAVICNTLEDRRIALAGFIPRLCGEKGTRWGSTFHNWLKTWYAPLLTRPYLFMRGVRLLYGDHAMFFRKEDFLTTGGCDESAAVMEEVGLCINFSKLGRTKLVHRFVRTSDRRIAALGRWRANWIYFKVAMMWAIGVRETLSDHYPDVR